MTQLDESMLHDDEPASPQDEGRDDVYSSMFVCVYLVAAAGLSLLAAAGALLWWMW